MYVYPDIVRSVDKYKVDKYIYSIYSKNVCVHVNIYRFINFRILRVTESSPYFGFNRITSFSIICAVQSLDAQQGEREDISRDTEIHRYIDIHDIDI